jgi:hypothetical protein
VETQAARPILLTSPLLHGAAWLGDGVRDAALRDLL